MADISKAQKIPGFMGNSELEWIAQQAATHSRIVEIGSLVGRSTRAFADNTSGFVLAVDDWYGPRDTTMSWKERQSLYQQFCGNLDDHIASLKVIPWKIEYADVSEDKFPLELHHRFNELPTFDLVFIDGDHQYKSVLRDINFWIRFMKPGALLCGHDYELSYPGVLQGLSETIGDPGVVPYGSLWWHEVTAEDLAKLAPAAETVGAA